MNRTKLPPVVAAIIPARGGSQGIPRKNLRSLAGKPLLWHTIQSAWDATTLSFTVVSTDDDEIASYAQSLGVEVVRHPPELSTDAAPTYGVIRWDIGELERTGRYPDICVVLRATSPQRVGSDIDAAVTLLLENEEADSVISVGLAVGIHPVRLKRVLRDGSLVDAFEPEGRCPRRRQEFEPLYLRNGAIYATRSSVIADGGLWGSHCLAYVMPEERSVNINTAFQFRIAELLALDGNHEAEGQGQPSQALPPSRRDRR